MRIGIVCYPSVGGSGIVATELAKQLAKREHEVHVISSDVPFRLSGFCDNIYFHQVETPTYPLFKDPPYLLTLANKLVEVSRRVGLDIIHAHYAIPHATAAFLAREILGAGGPKVVTTLHGTDITLMGADPSFTEAIAFSINRSDAVTAVSHSLREDTYRNLAVTSEIEVIPNFLECGEWKPIEAPGLCSRLARCGEKIIVHMSNFRKIKRVDNVIRIFDKIRREVPAKLVLIGDGPEMQSCVDLVNELGLRNRVLFMGSQDQVQPLLSVAALFLLPSEQESFGLAALEAMACGVPVIASNVGGLSEVVVQGETGFLCDPTDIDAMANRSLQILLDSRLQVRMSESAIGRVHGVYCATKIVPLYERIYRRVLGVKEPLEMFTS